MSLTKPWADMTPEEQRDQRAQWAREEAQEAAKSRKRAMVALRNLQDLEGVIRNYLQVMQQHDPGWGGPDPYGYTLDLAASDSSRITLHWTSWDGCHCHGREVKEETTIQVEDLLLDEDALVAKAVEAKEAREAREKKAEEAKAAQEKAEREARERAQLAALQAKYGGAGA